MKTLVIFDRGTGQQQRFFEWLSRTHKDIKVERHHPDPGFQLLEFGLFDASGNMIPNGDADLWEDFLISERKPQ